MIDIFFEQQRERGAATGGGVHLDRAVDGRGKIPHQGKAQTVFDPDIGLIVEQCSPLCCRDAWSIVGNGETGQLRIVPPGLPFDEYIRPAIDGLEGIGGEISQDRFQVIFIRIDLQVLGIVEYNPDATVTRV